MRDFDVIVIGSGAAGLTAALTAAIGGARVAVLEGSDRWGGTTAVSGAQAWIPGNDLTSDSREAALRYLRAHTQRRSDSTLEAFVDAAPRMARFVAAHSPIEWRVTRIPDSLAEGPGGTTRGRVLEPAPVALGELGDPAELFWPPDYPMALTNEEVADARLIIGGSLPMELIQRRMDHGEVAMGQALIAGLLHGCHAAGVVTRRGCRIDGLDGDSGFTVRAGEREWRAGRVVLACGGFEHDAGLRERLVDGPFHGAASPPVARGANLRLGGALGAATSYVGETWNLPTRPSGRDWPDGTPRHSLVLTERMLPHTIWVDRHGRRFVNESGHNCATAFAVMDPAEGTPRHLPAWLVTDMNYRRRYPLAGTAPGDRLPDEVISADSLTELARELGVNAQTLKDTVEHFNTGARDGIDLDFGRGMAAYDRHGGDPEAPHPNLGALTEPPFFAMPLTPGMVGTKGGLRTDEHARVLDWNDTAITGLYAAGNAAAAVIGPGTVSAGATIGSALTWGWIAGGSAAS